MYSGVVSPQPHHIHMTIETTTFTLPSHWASYLINGDASGLDDNEITEIDEFLAANPGWSCIGCEEFGFFSNTNDAGTLAGDCLKYDFMAVQN